MDSLRVTTWDSYIGQTKTKEHLRIRIDAAVEENRPLQHVLLSGAPGVGKTALARIIANEMHARFESLNMPVTERALFNICMDADANGDRLVLLLDELHRSSKREQEFLLPLLEFGYLQTRRGIRQKMGAVTIIGATTQLGKIDGALFDRFKIRPTFDAYTDKEMGQIVKGMARKVVPPLGIDIQMCEDLGRASGGIPRNAGMFVLTAHDLEVKFKRLPTLDEILDLCRVDRDGLTADHYEYLRTLKKLGSKSGLANIKNLMRLPEPVVQELERHLLELELIEYTDRGRELMPKGSRKIVTKRPREDEDAKEAE